MNKGITLIEAIAGILILSIVLAIIAGFMQTGSRLFSKGYESIIISNEYNDLMAIFKKDFRQLQKIKEISKKYIQLKLKNNETVQYMIDQDKNNIKIIRNNKEIKLNHIKFHDISFAGYNKNNNNDKIIYVKIFLSYWQNNIIHYSFEIIEI